MANFVKAADAGEVAPGTGKCVTVNGKEIEHKKWVSLPAKAKIGLAGKMVIEFESL